MKKTALTVIVIACCVSFSIDLSHAGSKNRQKVKAIGIAKGTVFVDNAPFGVYPHQAPRHKIKPGKKKIFRHHKNPLIDDRRYRPKAGRHVDRYAPGHPGYRPRFDKEHRYHHKGRHSVQAHPRHDKNRPGRWKVVKTWVPPVYKKVWKPGYHDRHHRWVPSRWVKVVKTQGRWISKRIWIGQ